MKKMSNREFRQTLKVLGLSVKRASGVLGISERMAFYYAHGRPVPDPIAKLLRLLASDPKAINKLKENYP